MYPEWRDSCLLPAALPQLAALEHMADRLLTALSSPGPRPLAEGAEIVADTTARLAELQAYMTQLQPTLARLEAVPQPPPAAIGGWVAAGCKPCSRGLRVRCAST